MNASPTSNTTRITAPLTLWRVAALFMRTLRMLFGDPSDVASEYTLTLKAHQLMASWLRCGEAMMRRLLLIEAQAFARPNTRPLLREPCKRTRKLMHFFAETPERWRVSFRCFDTPHRALSPSKGGECAPALRQTQGSISAHLRPFIFREDGTPPCPPRLNTARPNRNRYAPILRQDREWRMHQEPQIFRAARPLAARYEALLRAFNNPRAFAQRLSRRLHATPHRACELFTTPPDVHDRIELFAELSAAASASAAVFNTS